jgi:hypothetical protein
MGMFVIVTLGALLVFITSLMLDEIQDSLDWLSRKRRNKKLLANLSKDKEVPKPLGSLNKGDTLYYLPLDKFKKSLLTLCAEDVDKHLADKAILEDLRVWKVESAHGTDIDTKLKYFSVSSHSLEDYVDYSNSRIVSTSLELLSIYLKKMENDTKLAIIDTVKKNEASRDSSKVSKWLDDLNKQNLSLKK